MRLDATAERNREPIRPATHTASRPLRALVIILWLLTVAGMTIAMSTGLISDSLSLAAMIEEGLFIGLAFLLIATVGALAIIGQPRNAVGWLLLLAGMGITFAALAGTIAGYAARDKGGAIDPDVAVWLGDVGWNTGLTLLFVFLPYLFPDGRPTTKLWKLLFLLAAGTSAVVIGFMLLAPFILPTGFDVEAIESLISLPTLALPVFAVLGIASLADRYRRSGTDVRQQMKWLLVSVGLPILVFAALIFVEEIGPIVFSNTFVGLLYLSIPIGLGISLLRYKMFDVDAVIRKTALYTVVTALLALIYFGLILVLQRVITPFTGDSDVVVVLSTLLIAALFLPLRRRVQDAIDRRFYRRKYDAEKVLAQFAATARDETDLDALTAELLRVIRETMEPENVSLWLAPTTDDKPPATDRI